MSENGRSQIPWREKVLRTCCGYPLPSQGLAGQGLCSDRTGTDRDLSDERQEIPAPAMSHNGAGLPESPSVRLYRTDGSWRVQDILVLIEEVER